MSHAADRNLLFGVLALRMDFIIGDQLLAALNAWVREKNHSLGDVLVAQQALTPKRQAMLDSLVEEHLEQHGHDAEKSLAAVRAAPVLPEAMRLVPDDELRASLAAFAVTPTPGGNVKPGELTVDAARWAGGRYRILRPHARGGLGEVFVALDTELSREVALKEIQARHADNAASRARFVLEAEITGGLEHPGVVPLYGLGCYDDGRPFYAMRFIQGDTLKEAIERFHQVSRVASAPGSPAFDSLPFRQLLRRFLDVCNAVAYAHSRGVLHRDLKPANILLGKFGETLVVDWGLAKIIGRAGSRECPVDGEVTLQPTAGSGAVETLAGTALGTPAYMSPEQAAGKLDDLGPASDVYSLGATLYCLLTGRVPFPSGDAGAVLQKVQQGDFPAPRQVLPAVPRPLEAVCLKAMALRPAERYAMPQALAADLEHWLADEPVNVYPELLPARAGRWLRHHYDAVCVSSRWPRARPRTPTLSVTPRERWLCCGGRSPRATRTSPI